MSIGVQILGALGLSHDRQLLGGGLGFLVQRESQDILDAWSSTGDRTVRSLKRLSAALGQNFPDLPVPPPSQPMHLLFRGLINVHYVAACLCTRRSPLLDSEAQLAIAALRLWLFIKALEYHAAGTKHDKSLETLSNHLRMALDGSSPEKLDWFRNVARPSLSRASFEQHLGAATLGKTGGAALWQQESTRAIAALLQNHKRPIAGLDSTADPTEPYFFADGEGDCFDEPIDWSDLTLEGTDPEEGEFHPDIEIVETAPALTPPQAVRELRGIALQGVEDRQYLPLSWNRLRPDELDVLLLEIDRELSADAPQRQFVAAVASVSLLTRKSIAGALSIRITAEPADDWTIDIKQGRIQRIASRRATRWRAPDESVGWITPQANVWRMSLPEMLAQALSRALCANLTASTLGDLWTDHENRLEQQFNRWCDRTAGLRRVSSGLLAQVAEQRTFSVSQDAVFARLLTAPPKAGISGSGAYPSWPLSTVATSLAALLPGAEFEHEPGQGSLNGLGSELDPDDSHLATALKQASQRIDALNGSEQWLTYHNLLTSYTAALLLAATGARPVKSIFESSAHFDFEALRLFLDDKAAPRSADGTSGRIIPLPKLVADALTEVYMPYLRGLGEQLKETIPVLGQEVLRQADGTGSHQIPFLFFLRTKPTFDWFEVSEDSLVSSKLFSWPLPWNLFRHRLSVRLRRLGLSAELVDAQLGHAEGGSETHGDHSPRCWQTDYPDWSAALDAALALLRPDYPSRQQHQVTGISLVPGYQPFRDEQLFGSAARERDRQHNRKIARSTALREISEFLAGRPPQSLSTEEWERLGRKMLLREDNLPQSNSTIRYTAFEQYLQDLWTTEGVRVNVRRWVVRAPPTRSAFSADQIVARKKILALQEALDRRFETVQVSRTSKFECALLAALDVTLNGRVSDIAVVGALLAPGDWHLDYIIYDKDGYLEFSSAQDEGAGRGPVRRFLVPNRSLRLLERALSNGRSVTAIEGPPWLTQMMGTVGFQTASVHAALEKFCMLIDHDNRLRLPGIVAGLLAGRIQSYALWSEDWIRALEGAARANPLAVPAADQMAPSLDDGGIAPPAARPDVQQDEKLAANRIFLRNLRSALTAHTRKQKLGEPEVKVGKNATNTDSPSRRQARSQVVSALKHPGENVGSAIHALGAWVLNLLDRPSHRGLLDLASIERYLAALTPGFTSFGTDIDLGELEEDDLTEFYMQVVDPWLLAQRTEKGVQDAESARDDLQAEASSDGAASVTVERRRRDHKYVLMRLREFHRFARDRYGICEPDWSELDEGLSGSVGLPGFITPAEYRHALVTVCPDPERSSHERLRDAFVLLLTYRFGLRGGEAISLARSDWVECADITVLLVSGHHRKLKTRGSQRQVPLVGQLDSHERQIVTRWLEHWHAASADDHRVPLFFDEEDQRRIAEIRPIRTRLIQVLRACTASAHTNLHHARHSFANLLAASVLLPTGGLNWHADHSKALPAPADTRKLLLSTATVTRRSPWAVARPLGHSLLSTTFGSYLHCLHDWTSAEVRQLAPARFGNAPVEKFESNKRLDSWNLVPGYLGDLPPPEPQTFCPATPAVIMRYLQLRARGVIQRVAQSECQLCAAATAAIDKSLAEVAERLGSSPWASASTPETVKLMSLLSKIGSHRWDALVGVASACVSQTFAEPDQFLKLIGPSRQILIWEPSQLQLIDQLLSACCWSWSSVKVYQPTRLAGPLVAALKDRGVEASEPLDPVTQKKVIQIDRAIIEVPGQPRTIFPDRVAIVRGQQNDLIDNYELILLWASIVNAQSY